MCLLSEEGLRGRRGHSVAGLLTAVGERSHGEQRHKMKWPLTLMRTLVNQVRTLSQSEFSKKARITAKLEEVRFRVFTSRSFYKKI